MSGHNFMVDVENEYMRNIDYVPRTRRIYKEDTMEMCIDVTKYDNLDINRYLMDLDNQVDAFEINEFCFTNENF